MILSLLTLHHIFLLLHSNKFFVLINADPCQQGSGIGRETAFAFANAGARYIALLGRREYALRETADALAALSPQTTITVHSVNICDDQALSHIAVSIGTWDMLVHAAGPFSPPQPIVTTKMSNYWEAFEVILFFFCAHPIYSIVSYMA